MIAGEKLVDKNSGKDKISVKETFGLNTRLKKQYQYLKDSENF